MNPLTSSKQSDDFERMHAVLESMQAILPEGSETNKRMTSLKERVTLITKITHGIQTDQIACIIPSRAEMEKANSKNTAKIIYPDSGAFGRDAVLGTESMVKQKNPLLEIVKEKEREIHELINSIQLELDVKGDQFKTRFLKKSILLQDEIDDIKNKVVSGCARQKQRLKSSYPHLSNYEFIDENVNSAFISPSHYVHGKSLTPVTRVEAMPKHNLGLIEEFYAY